MKSISKLWASSFLGIFIGLGVVVFLEICHLFGHKILNHNLLFSFAIVWSTYKQGKLSGLFSVAIALVYTIISWSQAGNLFVYSADNMQRLIMVFLFLPLMALVVGLLKKQADLQQQQLNFYVEQLKQLAATDVLTEVANRRAFNEHLEWSIHNASRKGLPFSLAIIDLDYFKNINDSCGHQAGDDVLHTVGAVLRQTCRENDFPARIGGEEFAVLLHHCGTYPETDLSNRYRRDEDNGKYWYCDH